MAYADFGGARKFNLAGLSGSFLLTGGMVALLAFMSPDFIRSAQKEFESITTVEPTPPKIDPQTDEPAAPKDPPAVTVPDRLSAAAAPLPITMIPPVELPPITPGPVNTLPEPFKPPLAEVIPEPKPIIKAIVKTGVRPDPRYAGALLPSYPMSMRRAGIEGRVVVRVLVGADGRVKDITLVQSPDPAFFDATRNHALKNWRFKPATVDGKTVEAWFQMNLVFKLEDS